MPVSWVTVYLMGWKEVVVGSSTGGKSRWPAQFMSNACCENPDIWELVRRGERWGKVGLVIIRTVASRGTGDGGRRGNGAVTEPGRGRRGANGNR